MTLRDWLAAFGVEQVVIKATGVFWKPVWAILEDKFECLLVNARHVKQVPGRDTGAVKHTIICIIWHMLSTGELYTDLGGDCFRKRDPERITKRLIAQLESLSHKVTLDELPQAA